MAMLMLARLTASQVIIFPLALTGVAQLTYLLVWAAVLWIVVGAVVLANGGHLTRHPPLRRRVA